MRLKHAELALLLLLLPAAFGAARPVVLTTDCGVETDDQWALAHLAVSPEFDLRGIVTTHAPPLAAPAAETSARAARDVLDHLPLKIRPVILAGSSVPLQRKDAALPNRGVDFLIQQSRRFDAKRRLLVLVIGAATDVASALLADRTFADRIEIVAMGFNEWPKGTDPFNVKNDVKAWQVLLESRAPITVGDTAVTARRLRMTRERARQMLYSRGIPGRYLADLLVSWLNGNGDLVQQIVGDRNAWPIWDEVTVAHLLGFTEVKAYPRPRMRDDMVFEHPQTPSTITWVTEIDSDRLWADLARKLN